MSITIIFCAASALLGGICQYKIMHNILTPHGYKDEEMDGLLFVIPAWIAAIACAAACFYVARLTDGDWRWGLAVAVASAPAAGIVTYAIRLVGRLLKALIKISSGSR